VIGGVGGDRAVFPRLPQTFIGVERKVRYRISIVAKPRGMTVGELSDAFETEGRYGLSGIIEQFDCDSKSVSVQDDLLNL
jgi:hypothetical protein